MKLNPLLYKEDDHHNPTELLLEVFRDIHKLSITEVFKKYESILSPYDLHVEYIESDKKLLKDLIKYNEN